MHKLIFRWLSKTKEWFPKAFENE